MGKVIKLDQRVEIIAQDVEELKNSGGGANALNGNGCVPACIIQ